MEQHLLIRIYRLFMSENFDQMSNKQWNNFQTQNNLDTLALALLLAQFKSNVISEKDNLDVVIRVINT